MNDLAILKQTAQTMSSREIAQLCDKEHRNVLRDIDLLNETYTHMGLPKIEQGYYTHPSTGSQQHREFLLTKEQSIDLVTGYRCKHCSTHLDLSADHIKPESWGGETTLDNLQTLCRSCNSKKSNRYEG